MDILLIGALISISFQLETLIGISPKIGWFIVLAFGIFLLVFVMDEYYLGNFTKTWLNEVNRDRYDDPVGKWVQKQLQTAKSLVDSIFRNREPTTESLDLLTTLKLFGLYILLMAFLSPIWILISLELGNVGFAIILIIAVFVTRDLSRYMYLAYGKAKNLDDLAPRMSYGYILLGIKAIIIIGAFGYAFPIIST